MRSNLQKLGKHFVKKYRLSRVARAREGRQRLGNKLYNKVDTAVEVRMVSDFTEANVEFARKKKKWAPPRNMYNVKGTDVQACEKSSDLPTEQLGVKLWHLGQIASMVVENLLWAAAHLFT